MPVSDWGSVFKPSDGNGNPLSPGDLPLVRTLTTRKPATGSFTIQSLDGKSHDISVVSFPIVGMSDGFLGAIAIFWLNVE